MQKFFGTSRVFKRHFVIAFVVSLFTIGCQSNLPTKNTETFSEAVSAFYVGLAATQVGNDQRAALEMNRAAELASGEPAVWNNLGVLQLRQKNPAEASKSLQTARNLAPDQEEIYFNLAILAGQNGDSKALVENLNKVREINPKNLQASYLLATEFEKQKNDDGALKEIEKILEVDPENIAALIEAARLNAKANKSVTGFTEKLEKRSSNWSEESQKQFEKLKTASPDKAATEIAFLRNVLLREPAFRAAIEKIKPSDTTLGILIEKPLKLEVPDFSPAEPDIDIGFERSLIDDGDATGGVKIVYLNGDDLPVIAISKGDSTSVGKATLPISFSNPREIESFDFDYDYRTDIAYAGAEGFRLFKQNEDGSFEDITSKTGVSITNNLNGVWSFDYDNEGDLDLLLAVKDKPGLLLQNNGNGTFTQKPIFTDSSDITDLVYADLDEDGDSDAAVLSRNGKLDYYKNERGGLFELADEPHLENVSAISAGDNFDSGRIHLNTLGNDGEISSFEAARPLDDSITSQISECEDNCSIFVSDFDNNGANDVLVSKRNESRLFLGGKDGKHTQVSKPIDLVISGFADLDGDGKLDMIGRDDSNKAFKLINKSRKDYNWQVIRPKAAKTEGDQRVNTFGIGGEIEMRAGLLVQKQLITSPRVHFGLGNNKQADVARIVWQNGYVQAEFDIKTNQVVAAEQRLKGSCPHLFAWNGEEFAHVKDAPPWSPALGLKINAQDTYGILQTEEWFKISGEALKPKDGFYELRITGEYWEAYYIDSYSLMVVDHPEETSVFTDERFSIPLPPLKVFSTEQPNLFAHATDHNGKDVLETVSKIDNKYLDEIKRGKYQGVAEDHYVELDLPENAPLDKKLWIIADGWVHPTDASINVQRGQDVQRPPKSLSIEVENEKGEWVTAKDNLGFPAGKMKTVLLDLTGVFKKGSDSRKLRLRTEMEIFWDKLAWAVDVEGADNVTKRLELDSAELRYRGFSVINKADDSSPEIPDYSKILTTEQRWRDLEGYYTRFGDIKELLAEPDDRLVLANAGDEMVLKFPALPDVKKGFKRDFVIIGNGWIKDGDLNSVYSKTLLPLPTQASNDYSRRPTTLEEDPVYQKHKQDWLDFHTRYVAPKSFREAVRQVK